MTNLALLLGCLCLISTSYGTKETEEQFANLLGSKLWKEVEKRLGKSNDLLSREDSKKVDSDSKDECNTKLKHGVIIRSTASLSNGAEFIKKETVYSREECQKSCCFRESCNTAVYEHKRQGKHSCFLFNCQDEGICEFTNHHGYDVINIERSTKKLAAENPKKSHVKDVNSLKKRPTNSPTTPSTPSTKISATTSTSTVSPTVKPTTEITKKKNSKVNLVELMHTCSETGDVCETSNAECSDGFCQCTHGYHPKNHVCRKNCNSKNQFECVNGDAKITGPDCIALYDVCDGISQCKDGSDEKNCHESEVGKSKAKNPEKDDSEAGKSTTISSAKVLGKSKDGPHKMTQSTHKPTEQGANVKQNEKIDKAAEVSNKVTSDKGIQSQGAIVALSLGLSVTALLLLFVGCRYRNMRRKIGKGRGLNANEADYLINGMYL